MIKSIEPGSGSAAIEDELVFGIPADTIVSVGVQAPGKIGYYHYKDGAPEQDQFDVKTLYTGISAGTELTLFKGTNPYQLKSWNERLRAFVDNTARRTEIPPQKFMGYMEVGRVVASRTPAVHAGEMIATVYGHKTGHRLRDYNLHTVLPESIHPLLGIFVGQMGPVSVNALAHADCFLENAGGELGSSLRGKRVAVFGAGVVGMLTALLAQQANAEVLVVDRIPARLERARRLGLQVLNSGEANPKEFVKGELWSRREDPGADVIMECSGSSSGLHDAVSVARRQACVFALGFYQGEGKGLYLGEEFHHNGIRLICVQIGNTLPGWGRQQLSSEMVRRLQDASFRAGVEALVSHRVPFSQAQRAFDALSTNQAESIREFATDPDHADLLQVVLYPDADLADVLARAQKA